MKSLNQMTTEELKKAATDQVLDRKEYLKVRAQEIELMEEGLLKKPHLQFVVTMAKEQLLKDQGEHAAIEKIVTALGMLEGLQ